MLAFTLGGLTVFRGLTPTRFRAVGAAFDWRAAERAAVQQRLVLHAKHRQRADPDPGGGISTGG